MKLKGKFQHKPAKYIFAGIPDDTVVPRLYAFAMTDKTKPQVQEFDIDDDGLDSLSNLVRSEYVLAVVQGVKMRCSVESVVTLESPSIRLQNSFPLKVDTNG
jgi:hypothetical protein